MYRRIISAIVLLFILSDIGALAQAYSDSLSVTVYYPCGSSNVSRMPHNTISLRHFIQQLDSVSQPSTITPVSLFVTSSTSPEGSLKINKALTHKRNQAVIDYLKQHSETFRTISNSLDSKLNGKTTNHKFGKIRRSAFPSLRYSKVTLLLNIDKDTIAVVEQPSQDELQTEDSAETMSEKDSSAVILEPNDRVIANYPLFFVKTNLLYDLLTFVNASVEIPVTKNITAEATVVYPWWRNTSRHKTVQMRYVAVTPRYYFKNPDKPYTSLFAGLTIGGGKYDLQWTRRGVQGSMWHISPVIGYSHHISKRWKMEYSASVGFVHTKYQKYTQTPDTP
ncbi:MAG: DUF3575 domain-containing protein [Prevotella sp.]